MKILSVLSPKDPFKKASFKKCKLFYVFAFFFTQNIILTAQAKETSPVPVCTADQIEIAVLNAEGPYNGYAQDKATLLFHNLSEKSCALPERPKLSFLNSKKQPLQIKHEMPEEYHFKRFPRAPLAKYFILEGKSHGQKSFGHSVLFWISAPVYARGVCLKTRFIKIILPNMTSTHPFQEKFCGFTQTPWFEQSPLEKGDNSQKIYRSALEGQPEAPTRLFEGEKPIESSLQGQSEAPAP